ncbi:MAG: endonuclease/exonuclease/phosphatase family protein [Candidatus Dormibacteraeota bacterium]|nr:endonuclease/exonuclease/phosphatase family protein [Candidatus Dormibacteraeota bacterium]
MTFNLRMVREADGRNHWSYRAGLCARVVEEHRADLLLFQEMQQDHLDSLKEVLAGYGCNLGPDASSRVRPEHQALFWRADRLELLEGGGFYLSETPDRWSTGWDAACPRVATWVRLRVAGAPGDLVCCNTHLDFEGPVARLEGARLIARRLPRGRAEILAGDFNAPPEGAVRGLLQGEGFADTYRGPEQTTIHNFRGEATRRRTRIDWILVRGALEARSCRVVRDCEPPLYPSDHYPVVADLVTTGRSGD